MKTDLFIAPLEVNQHGFPQVYEDSIAVCCSCHTPYTNMGDGMACDHCRHEMEWYEDLLADMGQA